MTSAHETGHLLGLRHIFDFTLDPGKPATHMLLYPEPNDDRLMDYHSGFRLTRPEWEKVNPQPGVMPGIAFGLCMGILSSP